MSHLLVLVSVLALLQLALTTTRHTGVNNLPRSSRTQPGIELAAGGRAAVAARKCRIVKSREAHRRPASTSHAPRLSLKTAPRRRLIYYVITSTVT